MNKKTEVVYSNRDTKSIGNKMTESQSSDRRDKQIKRQDE